MCKACSDILQQEREGQMVTCPFCRAAISIPLDGVFPTNVSLADVVSVTRVPSVPATTTSRDPSYSQLPDDQHPFYDCDSTHCLRCSTGERQDYHQRGADNLAHDAHIQRLVKVIFQAELGLNEIFTILQRDDNLEQRARVLANMRYASADLYVLESRMRSVNIAALHEQSLLCVLHELLVSAITRCRQECER